MPSSRLLPFLLGACLFVSGCSSFMSPEDRDFYARGWVKPTDLDHEDPHRSYADPVSANTPANTAANRPPTAAERAQQAPPDYIVPQTFDNPDGVRR